MSSNNTNTSTETHKKPGAAPGTIEYIGERQVKNVSLSLFDYTEMDAEEIPVDSFEECKAHLQNSSKTWINIQGLHELDKLKPIWDYFDLHPLIQEDIVNTVQRAKVEAYKNCEFIVMRMLSFSGEQDEISSKQISIILGNNFVISFQESNKTIFKPIIDRLLIPQGRMQKMGVDYLAYALIDNITDYYFNVLDTLEEQIEQVEDELLDEPDESTFHRIHVLRKEVTLCRKAISPSREMLNSLIRDDTELIDESTKVFIRDTYDHTIQIIDNIENYREMIRSLHDMYTSHMSNKMNEVMKVLTIIATIFIPLTFIAGIYGMNFNPEASPYNMPELGWYWGYPAIWGVMIIIAIIMIIYFKHKDWL